MRKNYFKRLVVSGITLFMVLHVLQRFPYAFCEEVYPYNVETNTSSSESKLGIMEEIGALYDDLHIGRVGIKPSYRISEIYDDNVYNTSKNDIADFYTLHRFNIGLISPLTYNSLAHLDYNADIYEFTRIQELDRVNQSLKGTVDFNFAHDFKLSLSDQLRKAMIPPQVQRRFFGDIVDLGIPYEDVRGPNFFIPERNVITNTAVFNLDLPDISPTIDLSVNYINHMVTYEEKEFENSEFNSHTFSTIAQYTHPFLPITLSSGFLYCINNYESHQTDNTRRDIPFNITWTLSPKSQLYLNSYYRVVDYASGSNYENFRGWDAIVGYRYSINPVSSIEIFGDRGVKQQRRTDNSSYFYTSVGVRYTITHDRFDLSFDTSYYNITFFEDSESIGEPETVDNVSASFNLRYNPQKWWFAEFNYAYNMQDSVFSFGGFTKNVASLGVGLNF